MQVCYLETLQPTVRLHLHEKGAFRGRTVFMGGGLLQMETPVCFQTHVLIGSSVLSSPGVGLSEAARGRFGFSH